MTAPGLPAAAAGGLRWRNWPWAAKLALLLGALIVAPLMAVTLIQAALSRGERLAAIQEQNLQQARNTAGEIDRYLADVLADLRVSALAPGTVAFLESPRDPKLRREAFLSLRHMRDTHQFEALYLTGSDGTVQLATESRFLGRNYIAAQYFLNALAGNALIDEPRYDPADARIFLHASVPVQDADGRTLGVAVGRIRMSLLDDIIEGDTDYAGRDSAGVLWSSSTLRLSDPRHSGRRFRPFESLPSDIAARLIAEERFGPATARFVEPAAPFPGLLERSKWLLYDGAGDPYLSIETGPQAQHAAIVPLRTNRWLYGIFTPESAISSAVRAQTERNLAVALITALLAVALSSIAARWATGPLRLVGNTAMALAAGDRTRRVGLRQNDEVGHLASAFDAMADALTAKEDELRGYADRLEHRVEEQTAALRASEDELRTSFQSEQEARRKAEEANRLKDEFLSTVSHELRTPLNAILSWTWLLAHGGLDTAAVQRAVSTIERNARSQGQIIDDLLDVSRIITGKLKLQTGLLDLSHVIDAALDSIRPAAEAKGIRLEKHLDPKAATASGDPDRLQQIVWNLLSNAVKFTPEEGRVEIRLERAGAYSQIRVIDSGVGIRKDFLPYVFDRFRQADSSTTRTHGGLGLGLAIVRHLVELHGGTVEAESRGEGHGAAFTVRLPVSALLEATSPPRLHLHTPSSFSPERTQELRGLRILFVDDEADTREAVPAALARFGAEVETAASAAEALETLLRIGPDVLVADIGMPEEDGYSLLRKVRALPGGLRDIPAIALTAYAGEGDRENALKAGFQLHIAKPVEPQTLAAAVASLVRRTLS